MNHKKDETQIVVGIILGIAVGLLAVSVILLKYGGWMLVMVFPVIGPILLSTLVFGFLGWKGVLFKASRAAMLLMVVIGWPLCLLGPIAISRASLASEAGVQILAYPGSEKRSTRVVAIAGDGKPHVDMAYAAKAPYVLVVDHYLKEFPARDWTITNDTHLSYPSGKGLIKGRQITAVKKESRHYMSVTVKDGDPVSIKIYFEKKR